MRNISFALLTAGAIVLPLTAAKALPLGHRNVPAAAWVQQDPADQLWRSARQAISDGNYSRAADMYRRIRTEAAFKGSAYRAQSYYWEAYARAQMGGKTQLTSAQSLLEQMQAQYAEEAKKLRDVPSLLASIEGKLATKFGDAEASARLRDNLTGLTANADAMLASTAQLSASADRLSAEANRLASRVGDRSSGTPGCPDDDDNPKVVALNALMQMDAEAALPILEKVLARRDECSEVLRTKAVWLIAQKKGAQSADILLQTAKSDPNDEVRGQALFWLSQVDSDKALSALEEVLRMKPTGVDGGECRIPTCVRMSLHENALFALAQNKSERAARALREYAARTDIPADLRGNAIHWLAEKNSPENVAFLKNLFNRIDDTETKSTIAYAIASGNTTEGGEWLLDIATDPKQDMEIRKTAIYWISNAVNMKGGAAVITPAKLIGLYDKMTDKEIKGQLIFSLAQRKDPVFIDKLIDIAKNDRDPELRKAAIYWLGNVGSKDPRVIKFLTDLING